MQWDDIRIFLAIARAGSISGAAKRLSVQHSTVSRRLRSLEERLGSRLIERKKSGYELTETGEELQLTASKIEIEILGFEEAKGGEDANEAGVLHVSAINNMASTILMPLFTSFSKLYPKIELHIDVSNKFVKLAERDADIAIRLTNSPPDTLFGTNLATVASAVYAEKSYCKQLHSGQVHEKWLGIECCGFHTSWTKESCPDKTHNMYVDDTLLTLAALKEGAGLAYLPCFMGDREPSLERYQSPKKQHNLGLWLVYHGDLRRTKRVRLFREFIQREIQGLVPLLEGEAMMSKAGDK
ncbi:MAG: LysR family transcriptional regulator [Rhizobiales bacterium]|nr:LysR family transcriptional regulator [Hyphomicrobiales bacterium]